MKNQTLPIIAIVTSLVAIGFSVGKKTPAEPDRQALEKIDRRLRMLELNTDSRASSDDRNKLTSIVTKTDADIPLNENLGEEVRRLESRLEQLGVIAHFEEKQKAIEAYYTTALDREANSKDRIEALGMLRKAKRIDAPVVASMIDVWQESLEDEKRGEWNRWYLMENLEGVQAPEFRDSILEWIPEEESPKMRSRAIETLGSMLPDPAIDEWLVYLGENDPEPHLREQATKTRDAAGK